MDKIQLIEEKEKYVSNLYVENEISLSSIKQRLEAYQKLKELKNVKKRFLKFLLKSSIETTLLFIPSIILFKSNISYYFFDNINDLYEIMKVTTFLTFSFQSVNSITTYIIDKKDFEKNYKNKIVQLNKEELEIKINSLEKQKEEKEYDVQKYRMIYSDLENKKVKVKRRKEYDTKAKRNI